MQLCWFVVNWCGECRCNKCYVQLKFKCLRWVRSAVVAQWNGRFKRQNSHKISFYWNVSKSLAWWRHTINRTCTFVWYSRVKLAENFGREFQTYVSPIAKSKWRKCEEACGVIRDERRHAVDVCNMLGLSCDSCQRTCPILNMRQTAAKCVPPLLNNNQTQRRLSVCKHLQDHAKKTETFFLVITRLAMKIKLKGRRQWGYLRKRR